MIWPTRAEEVDRLRHELRSFSDNTRPLPGIAEAAASEALALQMVASLRRLDFTRHLMSRDVDQRRADPSSPMFDPERAAILLARSGNLNEAVWLIFLSIHFGKHGRHGWRRLRDVYSGLGTERWSWERVSNNVPAFREWLSANADSIGGAFGNHRKYESLNGASPNGTGAAVASYVEWIGPEHSHSGRFASLVQAAGNDPHSIFDRFYNDMHVHRFGRLGKFDFLALLGRLGLAPIEPGQAYLAGATGPLAGARLLFGGDRQVALRAPLLETYVAELDGQLQVGKQVMEDSLCNWQKSPTKFVHFKG